MFFRNVQYDSPLLSHRHEEKWNMKFMWWHFRNALKWVVLEPSNQQSLTELKAVMYFRLPLQKLRSPSCGNLNFPPTSSVLDPHFIFGNLKFKFLPPDKSELCNSISTLTTIIAGRVENRGSIQDRGRVYFRHCFVQDRSGAHTTFCPMGICGPFRGSEADRSSPSSTEG
jgi:hypothetical protein